MAAARRALAPVRDDPDPASNTCPTVHAMLEQAKAQQAQADAILELTKVGREMIDTFRPMSVTVHGFGERLEKLCRWLGGRWPWITLIVGTFVVQTISRAPEEAPKLIESLANLLGALV